MTFFDTLLKPHTITLYTRTYCESDINVACIVSMLFREVFNETKISLIA